MSSLSSAVIIYSMVHSSICAASSRLNFYSSQINYFLNQLHDHNKEREGVGWDQLVNSENQLQISFWVAQHLSLHQFSHIYFDFFFKEGEKKIIRYNWSILQLTIKYDTTPHPNFESIYQQTPSPSTS